MLRKRISYKFIFLIGGLLYFFWGLFWAIVEFKGCYPQWDGMCGTLIVFMNIPTAYALLFALHPFSQMQLFQVEDPTLAYVIFSSIFLCMNFVLGGLVLVGLQALARLTQRKSQKN